MEPKDVDSLAALLVVSLQQLGGVSSSVE